MNRRQSWMGRRVFLTGHTGFKGSWLALWLKLLGADVVGFSLDPDQPEGFFKAAGISVCCTDLRGDLRNYERVEEALKSAKPDVVFHLGAQALVRKSYADPLETLSTNVMGTAHVLEAVRRIERPCAVVVVTSDKAYENREWPYAYRESDSMGGHDVYSMSKGAAELVVSSYRRSFFPPDRLKKHGVALASARAGNVMGGGDWAEDRLVPDAIRALRENRPIPVRNPNSVRPWQLVLEPLAGYISLAEHLLSDDPENFCGAYNFGPQTSSARPVKALVDALLKAWGRGSWEDKSVPDALHEAKVLRLATDKAFTDLGWFPKLKLEEAVLTTVGWYQSQHSGSSGEELRAIALEQIAEYQNA